MSRELVDSNIKWLGKIPNNWGIKPLGTYLKERKEKVSDYDFEPLSVTKNGIVLQLENAAKSDAHDDRKKVCKGDFVINSRSDRKQSCGLSEFEGSVSLINIVLENKNYYPRYLKYLLDNNMFAEEFYRNGHGIVADLWTTKYDEMRKIMLPIPSKDEQIKIANYLDKKVALIDETIANNRKEIELLEEYKKSSINNELDNENWRKVRIKNTSYLKGRIGWQGLTTSDYRDEGAYLITGTDFENGTINWDKCVHISEERYEEDRNIHIKDGDLLITKDGTIGKLAIIDKLLDKTTLNSGVMLIRSNNDSICYDNNYLYYVLKSDIFWDWYESNQKGNSTIRHLYQEQFYNFKYPRPELNIQRKIAKNLDKKTSNINKVIKYRHQIIEKLEEYKKSLIYEAVTGKIEV